MLSLRDICLTNMATVLSMSGSVSYSSPSLVPRQIRASSSSSYRAHLSNRLLNSTESFHAGPHKPYKLRLNIYGQTIDHNLSKQPKRPKLPKHRPGMSKRHYHFFKRTAESATGTKAAALVDLVMSLSNVKEEIYGALDEWVAFEIEFPKIALGKALRRLKEREQWQRIIQVSKWMLNKGQGRTIGTYSLMLKAYEMDSRMEDCQALWESILARYTNSMPKTMFAQMFHMYKRQKMPREIIKLFQRMEDLRIRPDGDTLKVVKVAYKQIGQPEMQQSLNAKYHPAWKYLKYKGERVKVRLRPPREIVSGGFKAGESGKEYQITNC
ncbi:hypothetical protein KP509_16G020800 [Ceratopteris richardii]|uniref:Pentatricopeptide repeat-containing protein n=1 Tax=Ceratopteris richardii TaxID=49495 RepID=A0A8T2T064_CERRI|nr:hypothetical protein KP509_16G020800 [Ceratopteris richardii]